MHEPKGVGVRTTADTKEQMYITLRSALEENSLSFWSRCLTQDRKGVANQLQKLVRQMYNYAAIYSDDTLLFSKQRRTWTGKAMGEQDDLVIALQLAIFFRTKYMHEVNSR